MELANPFTVTGIDLSTFDFPKVEARTWSNAFSPGGSVTVEARTPEGTRITLHREEIEENRSVAGEREYAEELADNWNENCRQNWLDEILRCYREIAEYQQRKIDEFDKEVKLLETYREQIKQAENLQEAA